MAPPAEGGAGGRVAQSRPAGAARASPWSLLRTERAGLFSRESSKARVRLGSGSAPGGCRLSRLNCVEV